MRFVQINDGIPQVFYFLNNMTKINIDYDEFFEFDNGFDQDDVDLNFSFRSKFKIIDSSSGFKLILTKIFKRSLSKENYEKLDSFIQEKIPLNINDVSGIQLEGMKIGKIYDGSFSLMLWEQYELDKNLFDLSLTSFEDL